MNNLGDEGVRCVAGVLAKQPSLRRLDLHGNAVTGVGAQYLARGIAQFQIGVITNANPALDVQFQDKPFWQVSLLKLFSYVWVTMSGLERNAKNYLLQS